MKTPAGKNATPDLAETTEATADPTITQALVSEKLDPPSVLTVSSLTQAVDNTLDAVDRELASLEEALSDVLPPSLQEPEPSAAEVTEPAVATAPNPEVVEESASAETLPEAIEAVPESTADVEPEQEQSPAADESPGTLSCSDLEEVAAEPSPQEAPPEFEATEPETIGNTEAPVTPTPLEEPPPEATEVDASSVETPESPAEEPRDPTVEPEPSSDETVIAEAPVASPALEHAAPEPPPEATEAFTAEASNIPEAPAEPVTAATPVETEAEAPSSPEIAAEAPPARPSRTIRVFTRLARLPIQVAIGMLVVVDFPFSRMSHNLKNLLGYIGMATAVIAASTWILGHKGPVMDTPPEPLPVRTVEPTVEAKE